MYSVDAYFTSNNHAEINSPKINREWMDKTFESHAYKCYPISLANQLGWTISYPKDIEFIWDGISDASAEHVKVLSGEEYVYTERANATISFKTGIRFKTEKNISLIHMPVPNYFLDGVQAFTTIINSSFYQFDFPCAMMITKPNKKIIIKANTPIISILPIDLSLISEPSLKINKGDGRNIGFNPTGYAEEVSKLNQEGKWSNFYRNATDHKGNTIGIHQVKKFNFKIINDMV